MAGALGPSIVSLNTNTHIHLLFLLLLLLSSSSGAMPFRLPVLVIRNISSPLTLY